MISMIFGYAVITIVTVVIGAFTLSFAYFTLADKARARMARKKLAEADAIFQALMLKAAENKPAAVPGVYLAYRIVRDRPQKVDGDIADMLEQIARQG